MLIQEQFSDPKIYHHTFKLQNIKLQNWPQISIFVRKGQRLATFTHGPWSKDNFMHFFIVSWKVSYWMRIFKNVGKWFYGLSNITLFTLHRTVQFKKKKSCKTLINISQIQVPTQSIIMPVFIIKLTFY